MKLSSRMRSAPASRPSSSCSSESTSQLDGQAGPHRPDGLERRADTARGHDVVVLDQCGVRQRHAVVDPAAAANRVLLQRSQPGRGLAGVPDRRPRALQGVGPQPRRRGDPRQVAEEVQRRPLRRQQVTGTTGHREQDLPRLHAGAVRDGPLERRRPVAHEVEHRLGHEQAGHHAGCPRHEVGGADLLGRHRRRRGDVHAAVEVLRDGRARQPHDLARVQAGRFQPAGEVRGQSHQVSLAGW